MTYAGWIADLPDQAHRSLAADDREARKEAKAEAIRRQDAADAAENTVLALQLAGQEPETAGQILERRSELADRQAGKLDFQRRREAGEVGLIDPVVHRARRPDPDGVIDRALLAAEARRLDQRGQDAREAMEAARARHRPGAWAGAWASWLSR